LVLQSLAISSQESPSSEASSKNLCLDVSPQPVSD
jgi:hypothetical protein